MKFEIFIFTFIAAILSLTQLHAQEFRTGFKIARTVGQSTEAGWGVAFLTGDTDYESPFRSTLGIVAVTISGEKYSRNSVETIAPKFSIEGQYGFELIGISANLGIINYHTGSNFNDTRLIAEIGPYLFGFVYFRYGKSILLSSKQNADILKNRFTIGVNVPLFKL